MKSISLSLDNVELVSINNGEPKTTSLAVAKKFGKRHADVLRAIKNIDCSDEFSLRNFALSDFIDERGKVRQMATMTKDGFVFLVMGFTGKPAARFKEDYINEFNRMSDLLNGNIGNLMQRHNAKTAILKRGEAIASNCGFNLRLYGQTINPNTRNELKDIERQLQPMLTNFSDTNTSVTAIQ